MSAAVCRTCDRAVGDDPCTPCLAGDLEARGWIVFPIEKAPWDVAERLLHMIEVEYDVLIEWVAKDLLRERLDLWDADDETLRQRHWGGGHGTADQVPG